MSAKFIRLTKHLFVNSESVSVVAFVESTGKCEVEFIDRQPSQRLFFDCTEDEFNDIVMQFKGGE